MRITLRPAARLFTRPRPPLRYAARAFAVTIRAPRLDLAIKNHHLPFVLSHRVTLGGFAPPLFEPYNSSYLSPREQVSNHHDTRNEYQKWDYVSENCLGTRQAHVGDGVVNYRINDCNEQNPLAFLENSRKLNKADH